MNIIKKVTTGLLAAMALSWAQTAWAADNGTEFGIADDLSVYGATGTWADAFCSRRCEDDYYRED